MISKHEEKSGSRGGEERSVGHASTVEEHLYIIYYKYILQSRSLFLATF